jgi:hypothetical protein
MDNSDIAKHIRKEITRLTKALALITGSSSGPKKKVMSPSARRRIAAAQKARWKKIKEAKK